MNIKQSTSDGNIEVLDTLLRNGGLGEPGSHVDMSEHIILVHGDPLTKSA